MARSSDVHQLSFIDHWQVSQGDVLQCLRPLWEENTNFQGYLFRVSYYS